MQTILKLMGQMPREFLRRHTISKEGVQPRAVIDLALAVLNARVSEAKGDRRERSLVDEDRRCWG
jgi:hypothetical protein